MGPDAADDAPAIESSAGLKVAVCNLHHVYSAAKLYNSSPRASQRVQPQGKPMQLLPEINDYVTARLHELDQIPNARQAKLQELAEFVRGHRAARVPIQLTFICTHNSRRSHLSQVWAAVAAAHYRFPAVESFSGGTEATAFNPSAVDALRRAGFVIEANDAVENPRYLVRFSEDGEPLVCFSKVYSSEPNPQSDFCAVMTCSSADQACPLVLGASQRLAIPYDDPKVADGTDQEAAIYDERCAQIARELLYAFSQVDENGFAR